MTYNTSQNHNAAKQAATSELVMQCGTYYLEVWGCQMNVYDGQRLRELLELSGYVKTSDPTKASLIVLITCAVRAKAEDKVFNQIASWQHKGMIRPDTIIALGGCVGAELGEQVLTRCKQVQVVFAPRTLHLVAQLVEKFKQTGIKQCEIGSGGLIKFDCLPAPRHSDASAFVTIMEGCSNLCTYCIVPHTRGGEESRPVDEVVAECAQHLANGACEIHLLGQNVNSYRGLGADGNETNFAYLLYEVAALKGLKRLRFTTSNPMDFTDEIVKALADLPVIADAIHIPVQSGSDRILKLMNRRYTADSYRELIAKIRAVRPNIHISSDFIVGFPGESAEDFAQTMQLVADIDFDQSFSFVYSPRPGTPAAQMRDDVPLKEKRQRLYLLQDKLEQSALAYTQRLVGTTQYALVEGISRKNAGELKARTSSNHIVVFKGSRDLIGSMVNLKIEKAMVHTLKGELC